MFVSMQLITTYTTIPHQPYSQPIKYRTSQLTLQPILLRYMHCSFTSQTTIVSTLEIYTPCQTQHKNYPSAYTLTPPYSTSSHSTYKLTTDSHCLSHLQIRLPNPKAQRHAQEAAHFGIDRGIAVCVVGKMWG